MARSKARQISIGADGSSLDLPPWGGGLSEAAATREPYPALSVRDRLLLLGIAVAIFFAIEGRPWAHDFHWDAGIVWSYAAVPLLVGGALLLRRRFAALPWLLHSLEIAVGKFAVTAGVLLVVLMLGPPTHAAPPPAIAAPARPRVAVALPSPPAAQGGLAGRLLQHGAPPPAGTIVFLSSGLPDYAWPAPRTPVSLVNDGSGMLPRLAVVQWGQPITAASTDHRLHTLVLTQARSAWRLNVPLLAAGQPTPLSLGEVRGVAEEHCALHGAAERPAWLVILPHPFHQALGSDGRFALDGVPPGRFTLTAVLPDGTSSDREVTVRDGEVTQVDWSP